MSEAPRRQSEQQQRRAGKKRTAESVIKILRTVEASMAGGMTVADAVQTAHITEMTYYRWRKRYDGMSAYQVAWLMRLLDTNARLHRQLTILKTDKLILAEVSKRLLSTPEARRARVDHVKAILGVSERRACDVLGQHRSTQRKIPKIIGRSKYSRPSTLSAR
jgi:hypothetical protein